MPIKLGIEVRDKVTGFRGITTTRLEHLNGCVQYVVRPRVSKDKPETIPEGWHIDEQQLEEVGPGIHKEADKTRKKTGGAMTKCGSDGVR